MFFKMGQWEWVVIDDLVPMQPCCKGWAQHVDFPKLSDQVDAIQNLRRLLAYLGVSTLVHNERFAVTQRDVIEPTTP